MGFRVSYDVGDTRVNHNAAFAEITEVHLNYTSRQAQVFVNIYANRGFFQTGAGEVAREELSISDTDFDTFFADAVLVLSGNSPISQAQVFALTLPQFNGGVPD